MIMAECKYSEGKEADFVGGRSHNYNSSSASGGSSSSSSSGSNGKADAVVVNEDVLTGLIDYCESPSFMSAVDSFKDKHCSLFTRFDEVKNSEEDQPIELYDVFLRYQGLLDELIRGYAFKSRVSEKRIFQNCRDVGKISIT
jgi:hypothetical protein